MKLNHRLFLLITIMSFAFESFSQRGVPPRKKFRSRYVAKYPQHLDFLPPMLKLLKPAEGWEVSIAAAGLGRIRMMKLTPEGNMYVTRRDGADVIFLKDSNADNVFEEVKTVEFMFRSVHGITMKDGYLYLCSNTELRRYRINADGMLSDREILINDLPSGGQHPNRTIAFGPDGMLYITVGTLCNDCKEMDPEIAAILQVDPKTWKRSIYATGLRNTIGFDFHPQTKELWGFDNGSDSKGNRWPPEELNHIVKGGNYGYPFAYAKREIDQSREDPAGDVKEKWVQGTEPSVLELTPHMAPIDFKFFNNATNIPADFQDDGIVTWHGSWNRSKPVGFKVQRVMFENGVATGTEDFLTGFLKPGFLFFKRKMRFGRPAGVAITSNGVVYISDDANGVIYAVKRKK